MAVPVVTTAMPRNGGARSFSGKVIADRFRLRTAPTLLTRTTSLAPIGFSHLRSGPEPIRAREVPYEDAYSFLVALRPLDVDFWLDGRHDMAMKAATGDTFLFDLRRSPVADFPAGFEALRFYISQQSLDELAFDSGQRHAIRLQTSHLGAPDRVLFGIAMALMDLVERDNDRSTLLIDHFGLAFHAHVAEKYGTAGAPVGLPRGGLSPSQWRRATDYMMAHLDGDPTIPQLAQECGLSASYFARAFRQTAGTTPHQWLLSRRVERARVLLLQGRLDLAAIAAACGFTDQSHFTRVFSGVEKETPGRWRRRHI